MRFGGGLGGLIECCLFHEFWDWDGMENRNWFERITRVGLECNRVTALERCMSFLLYEYL